MDKGHTLVWEEATDSVMMFRVPGVTQPNQVCTRPVSLLDIYPTLADLAGIPKPGHLDGESLLPLLNDVRAPREPPAITVYDGHMSVRTESHRFIRYWDGTTELYDRTNDPYEWTNQSDNPAFADTKAILAGLLPPKDQVAEPLPSRQAGATNHAPRSPKPSKGPCPTHGNTVGPIRHGNGSEITSACPGPLALPLPAGRGSLAKLFLSRSMVVDKFIPPRQERL